MDLSIPGPRFSRDLPPFRVLVAVDLERFTSHPSRGLPSLSEAVPRVLEKAMLRSGLDWSTRRFPQSTGDGFVMGLRPELTPYLLCPFLPELQHVLEQEPAHLRMRVSIDMGPVPDSGGERPGDGVSKPMNDVHRRLDCPPLREALERTDPGITLVAAVISDRVFLDVIKAGYTALTPGELTRVRARVKEFSEPAWLYVPTPSGQALKDGLVGTGHRAPDHAETHGSEPSGTSSGSPGRTTRNTVGHVDIKGPIVQSRTLINSPITTTYTGGTPTVSDVHPAPTAELDRARDWYVPAPGVDRARELLHARHVAVLAAQPGGRRTTALHLLGELAQRTGISVVDVVKHWDRPTVSHLPLHTGCGFLLNLNHPTTDRPDLAFAEDLPTHAARLVDRGSYLVVIVRPELWRECWPEAAALTVELGRPEPDGVRAVHLARMGAAGDDPARPAALESVTELPALSPDLPPGPVVEWAELHASGLSPAPLASAPDLADSEFLRLTDPGGRQSWYPLRDGGRPRSPVWMGRNVDHTPPPDIALDSGHGSWISRKHLRLDHADGHWWVTPTGQNAPSLRRRGAADAERLVEYTRLRDGDVILIPLRPHEDGRPRDWQIEFRDPQDTHPATGRVPHENTQGETT